MKHLKLIIATFLILICNKAYSHDFIGTQTFTILAGETIEITSSGHQSATIDGITGNLSGALAVNFKITSNIAIGDLKVRALVNTFNLGNIGAMKSTATTNGSSLPLSIALGNTDTGYLPCNCCVQDALGIPTQCITTGLYSNAEVIAYTGTISSDNNGVLTYVDDANESYFTANIATNETNISLDLNSTAKAGSYNLDTAYDTEGTYLATIFIDNIPD